MLVCVRGRVQSHNQVVVWDKIISTPADALLDLEDEMAEYHLADQFNQMRSECRRCCTLRGGRLA